MAHRFLRVHAVWVALALSLGVAGSPALAAPPTACGAGLDAAAAAQVAQLTDVTDAAGFPDLVARHTRVAGLLLAHGDRRGLFSAGLDAVEVAVVLPAQSTPGTFADPAWALAVSTDLLVRYLRNLHAEVTGGPVEPHWARYFALARDCDARPAHAAMAGYNAHLTVDLARSVAAAGTTPAHAPDFYRVVDSIAANGHLIIDRTKEEYGADLGPLWGGYFVGDALDRHLGEGVGSVALLRAVDVGYNAVTFAHGLALQDPAQEGQARQRVVGLWAVADTGLTVLAAVGGL